MDNRFDEWTKVVAGEEREGAAAIPRREALRKLGLGLIGALLASVGLGGRALAAPRGNTNGSAAGGTTRKQCTEYCRRITRKAERDRCEQVCLACSSTARLCGTSGYDLVCCSGTCCAGVCTTLASDPSNCGACGRSCEQLPSVVTTCHNGTCSYACAAGWADCDGVRATGCETYLAGDPNNCGACGRVCAPGQSCCDGVCIDTISDPNNCGACGNNCSAYPGYGYCCGGYCSDLTSDRSNCGACGIVCPPSAPVCRGGTCTCPTNTWCSGVCVDLSGDSNNCGACGHACSGATPACLNGVCSPCPAGGKYCGGRCVNLSFDPGNCGDCGIVCSGGTNACIGGICQSPF